MFFKTYGLLGLNARTLNYIKEYNDSSAKKLADSKLATKDFLKAKGVSVVDTLLIISSLEELEKTDIGKIKLPFVVKPNAGFGGKGILIVNEKDSNGNFVLNDGNVMTKKEMQEHFQFILEGFYSLSGNRDKIIIEKKVILNTKIELLGKFGLPDLRVIVFNMVPVMAMFRIPTQESNGKANLHAGACGVGVDIGTGKLTYISHMGKNVKTIPGIGDVRGIELPDWDQVLDIAVNVQKITNVGFIGCDIVLDKEDGPLLLEMNIRPGLAVQLANLAPLKTRLKKVSGVFVDSVKKGVRLGKDLFGGNIEEKIQNISGKKVVGIKEYVSIFHLDKKYKYLSYIKPSISTSIIDKKFLIDILKIPEESLAKKERIKFEIKLLGESKKINFKIDNLEENKIILAKDALKGFLLDPFKYKKNELPIDLDSINSIKSKNVAIIKKYEELLLNIDKVLVKFDKKVSILRYLKPINMEEEKAKFIKNKGKYNPSFKYNELRLDLDSIEKTILDLEIPDIPMNKIFSDKKEEILNKIKFLRAFKKGDSKEMTNYSKKIFGKINEENVEYCKEIMSSKGNIKPEEDLLVKGEISDFIKKFNYIYNIKISLIERISVIRFAMKGNNLMIRKGTVIGKRELRSIIAHEIEGHYLRGLNGKKLKYKIFGSGTAGYLATEEGIAIYNQTRFLKPTDIKYYNIFERYFFINYAKSNSSEKLIEKMIEYYDHDYERVFIDISRIKRGFKSFSDTGFFAKDLVYVNGYLQVNDFLNNGGSLKELYIGKIKIEDLDEIKKSNMLEINFGDVIVPFFV